MKVFPTHLFDFEGHHADVERRVVSGGISLTGDEDVIATDGGGRVFVEFTGAYLDDPELALAWRAIDMTSDGGVAAWIVPLGDIRHQLVGDVALPPGGLPWWTEAEYGTSDTNITVAANAVLRATQLSLAIAYTPNPIRAGQWLSIDHPVSRHRAYRIAEVISQDGSSAVIKIRPPLREAVIIGNPVEMSDPRCTMRLEGVMGSPTSLGFTESGTVRFVEDFRDSYA